MTRMKIRTGTVYLDQGPDKQNLDQQSFEKGSISIIHADKSNRYGLSGPKNPNHVTDKIRTRKSGPHNGPINLSELDFEYGPGNYMLNILVVHWSYFYSAIKKSNFSVQKWQKVTYPDVT